MDASAKTKMVNGRVGQNEALKAARILESQGLTISAFIRNSIEYIARMGTVPESGLPIQEQRMGQTALRALIEDLESRPMPGRLDFGSIDEDELVERMRLERYGY